MKFFNESTVSDWNIFILILQIHFNIHNLAQNAASYIYKIARSLHKSKITARFRAALSFKNIYTKLKIIFSIGRIPKSPCSYCFQKKNIYIQWKILFPVFKRVTVQEIIRELSNFSCLAE